MRNIPHNYCYYLILSIPNRSGDAGKIAWNSITEKINASSKKSPQELEEGWINGIAIRSCKIDEEILSSLQSGVKQVVVLGAGLDTRPWRLHLQTWLDKEKIDDIFSGVHWFEFDFPEIFDFKLATLQEQNASAIVQYHHVIGDLSINDWTAKLVAAGYNPDAPSVWLLEGLTGYLTESECTLMFQSISSICPKGTRLIATFIQEGKDMLTTMHRFKPADPLGYVNSIGWDGIQTEFEAMKDVYNRPTAGLWKSYFLVDVKKL